MNTHQSSNKPRPPSTEPLLLDPYENWFPSSIFKVTKVIQHNYIQTLIYEILNVSQSRKQKQNIQHRITDLLSILNTTRLSALN